MPKKNPANPVFAFLSHAVFAASLAGVLLPAAAKTSVAQEVAEKADPEKGRALAEANCSPCHAIGMHDQPPARINSLTSFRDLHHRFPVAMLLDAAETGVIEGHDEMPAFDFSRDQIRHLLSYIDSLSPNPDARYVRD